jgi:hypothetical protein
MRAGIFPRLLVSSLVCAIAFASPRASAAEDVAPGKQPKSVDEGPKGQPQTVAVDLKRLGIELDLYAAEAKRTRLATAITGLGIGGLLIPSGAVLLGRTDGISRALVIGMVIGGSAQVLSVPLVFIPTRMDEIRHDFISRPASSESKATIREIETEWRLAAEASRRRRGLVGTTLVIVGAVHLATGLSFLLAPNGLGMSRKTQYTWGGITMGIGVPVTTLGVRFLLEWSQEEMSWQMYRSMKSDAGSLSRLRVPAIGVAPMQRGALAFVTMPF